MPNLTESERVAGMVPSERGENTRQLAAALIGRATELVETLPVAGGSDLTSALSKLHVAGAAVSSIPLVITEAT